MSAPQDVHKFVAKIGFNNTPSQRLFHKLGFREAARSTVFQEVTFQLGIGEVETTWLRQELANEGRFEEYDLQAVSGGGLA